MVFIPLVVIFGIAWLIGHTYINQKYKDPELVVHQLGETFLYKDTVEITITDFEILPKEEFYAKYNIDPADIRDTGIPKEEKDLVFKVTVKNPTDKPVEINMVETMLLQVSGFATYTDLMETFRMLNPQYSGLSQLQPGEEESVLFPYHLYDYFFRDKKDFENIEELPASVVFTIYPKKEIVQLN